MTYPDSPGKPALGSPHGVEGGGKRWETFCDAAYYDLWCVRQVGQRKFGEGYHVQSEDEARHLCDTLNDQASALKAVPVMKEALESIGDQAGRNAWGSDHIICHTCAQISDEAPIALAALEPKP